MNMSHGKSVLAVCVYVHLFSVHLEACFKTIISALWEDVSLDKAYVQMTSFWL